MPQRSPSPWPAHVALAALLLALCLASLLIWQQLLSAQQQRIAERVSYQAHSLARQLEASLIYQVDDLQRELAQRRDLAEVDRQAEEMLAAALEAMPKELRRKVLLGYLGFPFYDVATLPLSRREGLDEFNPVKIDRISPDDALSIREGGTAATLRGIEFYNFGAFFSRDYRENDYLWGRLHGAERMIDLVASTVGGSIPEARIRAAQRAVFMAIREDEEIAGRWQRGVVDQLGLAK